MAPDRRERIPRLLVGPFSTIKKQTNKTIIIIWLSLLDRVWRSHMARDVFWETETWMVSMSRSFVPGVTWAQWVIWGHVSEAKMESHWVCNPVSFIWRTILLPDSIIASFLKPRRIRVNPWDIGRGNISLNPLFPVCKTKIWNKSTCCLPRIFVWIWESWLQSSLKFHYSPEVLI